MYEVIEEELTVKNSEYLDITNFESLYQYGEEVDEPDIIFHLAAQPLVSESYSEPLKTWKINVMGSINLLELTRLKSWKSPIIVVTTDKVYENVDYTKAYVETDRLGGLDPYSSSKAALELAVKAWRNSFTGPRQREIRGFL